MTPPKKLKAPSHATLSDQAGTEEIRNQTRLLLLPQPIIETNSCRVVSYMSSAQRYSGDWWGWTEVPRKRKLPLLLLLIGDATGHGAPAAIMAGTVRGALSVISTWASKAPLLASDPREVLRLLNRVVFDAAQGSIVMTLNVILFDPSLGVIHTSNAGHNFPYLLSPADDGSVDLKALGEGGIPLGQAPDTAYNHLDTYSWTKESKLFLYTDGLIDCFQGETNVFDRRKLQKYLRENGRRPAKELLDSLIAERQQRVGGAPQADDVTVVVSEMKG